MSTTPNEPRNPQSGVPGQEGHTGPAQPGQPAPYGQAGGKYGTAEYNPGQYTGLMERPSTFDRLLKLTLVSLGLYLINAILSFVISSTVDLTEIYRNAGISTDQATDAANRMSGFGGPGASIIGLVIQVALYVLVYVFLKKGANWARVLGTVLAALAIVGGLISLFGSFVYPAPWNIIMIVVVLVKLVVDILWIVTAYRAPTSAWFKQHQTQR